MSSLRMTPTMLHSIDREGRIEEVSDLWLSTLGYSWEEVIGRPSTDFLSEESRRYASEVVLPMFFRTGACEVEYDMVRKDGTLVPVRLRGVAVRSENGAFVRSIAVIEDLTQQRALEAKMFAAQKLESLGLMAGNIAHDFNNLLASVVGNAQLALKHANGIPPAASSLNNIMIAAARAADLCRQLLAYSGRGQFQIEETDLDALVTEMSDVLRVNVGKHVKIVSCLASEGVRVHVDATQIRQIVMNLVLNAGEALGDREGTISIATDVQDLDADTIAATSHPDATPGRYIALAVTDEGGGMPPEVLDRIFDPFFTTKTTGRGLGLAAVHGIVRGHHGTLTVRSTLGVGTTFTIFLPIAEPRRTARQRATTPSPAPNGRILVVDDDELLRATIANQLTDAGYEVLVTASEAEAIELTREHQIRTFLIDVTMPGLAGPELAQRIRRETPDAHIVMMSGYNRVDMPPEANLRFVQKPFTEVQLLEAIARRSRR